MTILQINSTARSTHAEGMSRGPEMVGKAFRGADSQIAQLVA
ncbi:hypothetical protein FBZ82_112152 [Azospirillum brasilense]|uniref:Uncharacterized protein n=1 Tax=Azospirillum brasilense TaxID=192 RepID=A0A560AU81_AZOBR|nr:hypothetical protein [Azospirillum brasilense]TWA63869.1 hypothetical protein FBZ82_112152 [Azospirillum brasilense]